MKLSGTIKTITIPEAAYTAVVEKVDSLESYIQSLEKALKRSNQVREENTKTNEAKTEEYEDYIRDLQTEINKLCQEARILRSEARTYKGIAEDVKVAARRYEEQLAACRRVLGTTETERTGPAVESKPAKSSFINHPGGLF